MIYYYCNTLYSSNHSSVTYRLKRHRGADNCQLRFNTKRECETRLTDMTSRLLSQNMYDVAFPHLREYFQITGWIQSGCWLSDNRLFSPLYMSMYMLTLSLTQFSSLYLLLCKFICTTHTFSFELSTELKYQFRRHHSVATQHKINTHFWKWLWLLQ